MDQQPDNQEPVTQPPVSEQPAQAPVAPAEQPAPSTPSPFIATTNSTTSADPKRKKPTGLITAIVIIVVIIAAAVGVWFAFFYVSKADYNKAQTALNSVHDSYNTVSDDLTNVISDTNNYDPASLKTDSASLKKDLATYQKQFNDLGNQRAMLDSSVKKKYDAAATQNKQFVSFINTLSDSLPQLLNISNDCSADQASSIDTADPSTISAAFNKAVAPCISDLKELSNSKNTALAKYGSDVLSYYNQMESGLSDLQTAYNNSDYNGLSTAEDKISSLADQADNSNTQLTDAANKSDVSSQMNDLQKVLQSKIK